MPEFNIIIRDISICSLPTASMGLNYDLGDKSENSRRMNHFEKFNKANIIFFMQKMLDFSSIMCVFKC